MPLRTELCEAAHGAPSPAPKMGGDGYVQFDGLSSHQEVTASAPVVQAFATTLIDSINGAIPTEVRPIPYFNHAEWGTTTPEGVSFITPHRDPATAIGVIAIATLEGAARFCVWDDTATDLAPALHRDDTAHQWDTSDGDMVILRCEGWPSSAARSPVHEARSPEFGQGERSRFATTRTATARTTSPDARTAARLGTIGQDVGVNGNLGDPVLAASRKALIGEPERVEIVVVDYDESWPTRFDAERHKIETALGGRAMLVEHVGSTAVAELAAKPIIDICIAVVDSSDENFVHSQLRVGGLRASGS